jgi:phenylpropionate dioxygenase-like ring-hydroxylating dioxygenase large terminal subunit
MLTRKENELLCRVEREVVVFRDSDGRLDVLDEYCPHRFASLALCRNEECAQVPP